MRRIIPCSIILLLVLLICGCTQPAQVTPATPVAPVVTTPAPTQVTLPPATPATAPVPKQLNFSVSTTKSELVIQYNGGPDAAEVAALRMRIDNHNSQDVERLITYPPVGSKYVFTYQGVPDPNVVNIIGVFNGGYEQTVLMYYI